MRAENQALAGSPGRRGRSEAETYDERVKPQLDLLEWQNVRAWRRGWEVVNALTDREAAQRTPEERLLDLDELYRFGQRSQRPDPALDFEIERVRERWVALRRKLGDTR
jgi:hypothetical protein